MCPCLYQTCFLLLKHTEEQTQLTCFSRISFVRVRECEGVAVGEEKGEESRVEEGEGEGKGKR